MPGPLARLLRKAVRLVTVDLERRQDAALMLLGALHAERVRSLPDGSALGDAEFKVYSQWGEDGILQYLTQRVPVDNPSFVEFGVEDYREANTRFLLRRNNWRGLVIDGDPRNVREIRKDPIHWQHDLTPVCRFVTPENIDSILAEAGFAGDISLLSIDIDGNDYWVWRNIRSISPRIVVCEYNSVFGNRRAVSIPYRPEFQRTLAHFSNLYWGASLPALCHLADSKGYDFVGCNSAGVNAFFVRRDLSAPFRKHTPESGYVLSRFRDSSHIQGRLTYVTGPERLKVISTLPIVDVIRNVELPLSTILDS